MKVTFDSVHALVRALRQAAEAHARHKAEHGHDDPGWPAWYAHHMAGEQTGGEAVPPAAPPDRFTHLPPPIALEDTIAGHPAAAPPDPQGGRDPDRDFLLRYGGT
ncbi:hypothetical protein EDD29_5403 [Actinocorallia herbida]|uniref:Uncharacterized protein n=1 Tax=Actinocorallia herbida TaxID=58109 RepID=A0A3N1D2K8_9ACTN|nr:hypothetical protein [Actinocorallia herbida]ROO87767.1 hypothetical protein EDD29_5403 [Actinocorallia herbida]